MIQEKKIHFEKALLKKKAEALRIIDTFSRTVRNPQTTYTPNDLSEYNKAISILCDPGDEQFDD